ncbi:MULTISPECIES: hypothetical protein [unclassified Microbacterium]|uniref:hypothetical protein n=1 Tax=unclassified Microbacterium TaxID=2609290 RepID=UPI001BEA74C9|nr:MULTISPECIES: hypothetical protein [unclassified Microbacterium]MBT2486428.1 hypothetical protein [Microbacterium sp. ISL-108]
MTIAPDILVAGATGSTGRATTDSLTARGIAFRSMSRRPPSVEFGVQVRPG